MRNWVLGGMLCFATTLSFAQGRPLVLKTDELKKQVNYFNSLDSEDVKNYVSNAQTFDWLATQAPLFECPDSAIQKIYYYRWWTFRKHLKQTPDGFVFTEFITPVNHAGKYNTVSSALGHQVYEGRWLKDPRFIKDYLSYWLLVDPKNPAPKGHAFSSWIDDAVLAFYNVVPDKSFISPLLPVLDADYAKWETEKQNPDQLFWQFDVRDAMEESISGGRKDKNERPTINSYMYGNARALAQLARLCDNAAIEQKYAAKAATLKRLVQSDLWDPSASFFKVKLEKGGFSDAREELGFIPWYFSLPDDDKRYAKQWDQLLDTAGFKAPWGITTAERRHPLFRTHGSGHGCEWDGAVWPFATTQTLKGLANLLRDYHHKGRMNRQVFYDELHRYAMSHVINGRTYIGEYQDEKTGEWLKGDIPRSRFYNHSGFCDLVISDLVGLKPRADDVLEIDPLVPEKQWDWFCLDNVTYHGKSITILWDKTGRKYGKGRGLHVFADGSEIARKPGLTNVQAVLK